jgi:hypothetical protein
VTGLDRLATERIRRLSPRARGELYRAVEAAEARVDLFHRHRPDGPPVPHPIALTPLVVSRRALPGLRALADAVHRLQAHAPGLYRDDVHDFRALCPVSETTARWIRRGRGRPAPWQLMVRPDVGLEAGDGAGVAPVLFETNATGLAGLYNHAAGARILREVVFPRIFTPAESRRLADPPDLLALTVRWVVRAARRLGRRRPRGVAFIEEGGPLAGYSEVPRLVAAFEAAGIPAVHGTAPDLRVTRGGIRLRDAPVDLVYRDLAYDDLGPPPEAGGPLAGYARCAEEGAVVPGDAGEFAHKGLLECLDRPEYRRLFSPAERRLLRATVPWTRVLSARFTDGPDGRRIDLPAYVRRAAAGLLIKPNVGSSGVGVLLGREATPARWEARIARALREPGAWVVQARRPGRQRSMAYLRAGAAFVGPCYLSLGLFYTPGDLGLHCRVSRDPIVNVARRGALACAFLEP